MFGIHVHYLTGRCVSTAYNDRSSPEWPPHPARLYSALVSVAGEERTEMETEALRWLEQLSPPSIHASPASIRDAMTVFVPVNDTSVLKAKARVRLETLDIELAEQELAVKDARQAVQQASTARDRKCAASALVKAERALGKKQTVWKKQITNLTHLRGEASKAGIASALGLLPGGRLRQPRAFPSVTPEDSNVWFLWPEIEVDEQVRETLDALTARVSRLGHSSSLVTCEVVLEGPSPNWVPDRVGSMPIRTPMPGQLQRLDEAWERHQGVVPRVLPARIVRYRHGERPAPVQYPRPYVSGEWFVFERVEGPKLPLPATVDVAVALRGALLAHAEQPALHILTGHAKPNCPSQLPHAVYLPLGFVGRKHASGSLLGAALVLPHEITEPERCHVLRAIAGWLDEREEGVLTLGRRGVLRLKYVSGKSRRRSLHPTTWSRPSRQWVSVTPVALDRNPGNLRSLNPSTMARAVLQAEAIIARACMHIGLPRPARVCLLGGSPMHGVPPARGFPSFPRSTNRFRRVCVHASLHFDAPVSGPLVIGAGRYQGLGLFRPVREPS